MKNIKCFFGRHKWKKAKHQFQSLNNPLGIFDVTYECERCGEVKIEKNNVFERLNPK